MAENMQNIQIPKEMFEFVNHGERIADKKFEDKPIGYFKDAWIRFRKNKASVMAAIVIIVIVLFAFLMPVFNTKYDSRFMDAFYAKKAPRHTALRRFGINIISLLIRILTGAKIKDTTSGFRACNKELTAFYARHYAQDFPEPEAIVSAVCGGWRVGEVPVVMEERMGGTSSIRSFKSAYYMIKVTLSLIVYRLTCGKVKQAKEVK